MTKRLVILAGVFAVAVGMTPAAALGQVPIEPGAPEALAAPDPGLAGEVSSVSFKKGVFTATLTNDDSDSVEFDCAGMLTINALEPINGKSVPCNKIKQIEVFGRDGDDSIDLYDLDPTKTPNLTVAVLNGGAGADYIEGWTRKDIIVGGGGSDECLMQKGGGSCNGGPGFDTVYISGKNPKVVDATTLRSSTGKVKVKSVAFLGFDASSGNDAIDARRWKGSQTSINGFGGNDTILGCACDDEINPGADTDVVKSGKGDDVLRSDLGSDTLNGGPGLDTVYDVLGGSSETTTLTDATLVNSNLGVTHALSGIEHAEVRGNTGAPLTINAAAWTGTTYLQGGAGNDSVTGGFGDDLIGGHSGTDTLDGGPGSDLVFVPTGGSFALNAGPTQLTGSLGTDTFSNMEGLEFAGSPGVDVFNGGPSTSSTFTLVLNGLGGNDALTGGSANDTIRGGDGDDTLTGNGGDDTIDGEAGTDTCNGGTGTNTILNCE